MPREKSSWLSSAGSSKLIWWLLGGVPEDEFLGAHEVEVGDDQAIVVVDPDGHEGLAGGALGAHRGGDQLDLLLGHALDHDLAGGSAADRGDDGQAIGADGDVAVGGRLGTGAGWACSSAVKASFQSSCSSPWRKRSGFASTSRTTDRSRSSGGGFRGDLLQAELVAGHRGGQAIVVVDRGEGVALLVLQPRAVDQQVERIVELGDQRGRDVAVQGAVELDAGIRDVEHPAQR